MSLLTGLVSYWKFDETSGTTASDSHGSNNGTANNSRVFWTAWKINNGADFTKGDDNINIPTSLVNTWLNWASVITLAFWVKRNSINSSQTLFIARTSANNAWIQVDFNSNNTLRLGGRSQTSDWYQQISTSWTYTSTSDWYFIAAEFDYVWNRLKCYINNTQVFNTWVSFWSSTLNFTSNLLSIGSFNNTSGFYNWLIDELAIYNRALSSSEISELYNNWDWLQYPFATKKPAWFLFRNWFQ